MISVFYDSNCVVCNAEINYYRKKKLSHIIDWIDISSHDFNPTIYGLDQLPFKKRLYAKKDNHIYDGIDTFLLIWETLEIWPFMVMISQIKSIRKIMDIGYYFFTIIRPYLPKRHKCDMNCKI